jgi:diaminohydroxyphosphoribosylaminopyrimidine deaminase/5-amino-6-(5-phosphoribosylamino)uracil reductase
MALDVAAAMRLAVEASENARGSSTPNPPVGAVILNAVGDVVGVGHTSPAGGPHAEVNALRAAGDFARGGTAVVTLEPCNHTGRTGPCTRALIEAGVSSVVFAVTDPNPVASGGAQALESAGITVTAGVDTDLVSAGPLRAWLHRQRAGRPHVTWKYAASLDGRIAAADGTSRWITGPEARAHVHAERAKIDAVIVGTGTVFADDPWLTARLPDGSLAPRQPVRVVVGHRAIAPTARILDGSAETRMVRSHDPHAVLDALSDLGDVVLEGGPTVVGSFLAAGLVDRVTAYIAPVILGAGPVVSAEAGVGTIADALRFRRESVRTFGPDTLISLTPDR